MSNISEFTRRQLDLSDVEEEILNSRIEQVNIAIKDLRDRRITREEFINRLKLIVVDNKGTSE